MLEAITVSSGNALGRGEGEQSVPSIWYRLLPQRVILLALQAGVGPILSAPFSKSCYQDGERKKQGQEVPTLNMDVKKSFQM